MAYAFSDYLENALLNATLRGVAYIAPSTVYVALFTSDPTDTGTGGTEVTGGAYARQAITFNAPTAGSASNSADVLFPIATAAWGTITHLAFFDAATAGNMLYSGQLTTAKTIATDDQLKLAAGNVTVTLD
jgi:hypothetical protein